jgi:hypothetical protein
MVWPKAGEEGRLALFRDVRHRCRNSLLSREGLRNAPLFHLNPSRQQFEVPMMWKRWPRGEEAFAVAPIDTR